MLKSLFLCLLVMLLPFTASAAAKSAKKPIKHNTVRLPDSYRPAPPQALRAEPSEWAVELTWNKSRDPLVTHYVVYAEADADDQEGTDDLRLEKLAEVEGLTFREEGLDPDSEYSYWVAAVAENGRESDPVMVETATLPVTRPPIEMDVVEMKEIFTNNYKIYQTEGIGSVRVRNNTPDRISRLKVSLTVREYMDFPSELELRDLEPHESRTVMLKGVLNNRVLDIHEDTPLQTEIVLSYFYNGQLRSYSTRRTVMMHEKHRMIWKDAEMAAVFVTPKDPTIIGLTRAVVAELEDSSSPLMLAGAIYETLGLIGITYVRDPSNPYQISDGKVDTVDYVQYPVETLERKSGDCKAMVMLYSSLLESVGIRTMMLDYPGHMFMMFSLGKGSALPKGELAGLLLAHDGELWAPVELTLVGSRFLNAWEQGSRSFAEWSARNQLGMMDTRKAWTRFKPATVPPRPWRGAQISRNDLERAFGGELVLLRRLNVQIASVDLFDTLLKKPDDYRALLQIGIRFGENGDSGEAARYLERALAISPRSAEVLNNLANVRMIEGKHQTALELYRAASAADPADPLILANMARCQLKLGQRTSARETFQAATRQRPEIAEEYRALAVELAH